MPLAPEITQRLHDDFGKVSGEADHLFTAVSHFVFDETLSVLDWPELIAVVEQEQAAIQGTSSVYSPIFPILTCMATNGPAETAVPLAAAWWLYNLASDLFDDLQDRDGKKRLWNNWEPAKAMNVGLGLVAAGNLCLTRVQTSHDVHRDILASWARTFAQAAQGQISSPEQPSLETYFRQTIAKSGLIYATVARAGARLETNDSALLKAVYDYGYALGMVVQIMDDCRDLASTYIASDLANGTFTLPAIYALSQKEAEGYPELSVPFASSRSLSPEEVEKTLALIIETNALSRSLAFAKFYEQKALDALQLFPPENVTHLTDHVTHFLANTRLRA